MRSEAPNVKLRFTAEGEENVSALREGRIDLDIGVQDRAGPEVKTQVIFRELFVGIVRTGHHLCKGRITPRRYAACSHVVASRRGLEQGPVDHALAALGLSRRVAMIVPSHTLALNVVAKSDLVGTLPGSLAERAPRTHQALQPSDCHSRQKALLSGKLGIHALKAMQHIGGCAPRFARCAECDRTPPRPIP